MPDVQVGDIVTVNKNDDCYHHGIQGEVIMIAPPFDFILDGYIHVKFQRNLVLPYITDDSYDCVEKFHPHELILDGYWSAITRARTMFKWLHHSITLFQYDFSGKNTCMVKGCAKKSRRRIVINFWGTVQECDVCERHTHYDCRMVESFPWKKKYHPIEKLPRLNLEVSS